ncbi:MAG: 4Fe-4S dicluster protein [Chloroflexi bacterium]|jgi:NADPH-dependent glutamate synthase beta subunit-like oxidoreductase|nr:4Fe-4S dicluster protein [Chloroflexota bacterium]
MINDKLQKNADIRFAESEDQAYPTELPDTEWFRTNVPCQYTCPAHTDVSNYIGLVAQGRFDEAYILNRRDNVFPGVLGRVCARPCESTCRRGLIDKTIRICWLKRSASDFRGDKFLPRKAPVTRKEKIAIIGAGSAGLSAARDLAIMGYKVIVYEMFPEPGGMMVGGIPIWRLPRDVVQNEVDEYFNALGVEIRLNTKIGYKDDISLAELLRRFDAVIMAPGSAIPAEIGIPGETLKGYEYGLPWLEKINFHHPEQASFGKRVVVLGMGFTAMDCCRSARRMGAEDVTVVYRRTQLEAPVEEYEIEECELEGIKFIYLSAPLEVVGDAEGKVTGIKFIRNKLGAPDKSGRRSPVPIEGSEFIIPADVVIPATGQWNDTSWIDPELKVELQRNGNVKRDPDSWMTNVPGLFAGGDYTEGSRNLIAAIADGHKVANGVHEYLTGQKPPRRRSSHEIMEVWRRSLDYEKIERQEMRFLELDQRFPDSVVEALTREAEIGFTREMAMKEATRCLQCAYNILIDSDLCILCAACVDVCPEKIIRLVPLKELGGVAGADQYQTDPAMAEAQTLLLDENECIRCGLCVVRCPTQAIKMARFQYSDPKAHWYVSEPGLSAPIPK